MSNAGSPPVDLNLPPNAAMPLGTPGPVFASWSKRVLAAVLDGAIGAGTTFLAFGDQPVTVPFLGTAFQPTRVQGVPSTSWTDSGWVISAVLLVIVMQAYLGVTPGKIVMGIAVVHERDGPSDRVGAYDGSVVAAHPGLDPADRLSTPPLERARRLRTAS